MSEYPLQRGKEAKSSVVIFEEIRTQPMDAMMEDREDRNDFWSIEGNYICHHHVETRIQLLASKEEPFPVPLRHIDVTKRTHTTLEVLQECRTDDFWNFNVDRN